MKLKAVLLATLVGIGSAQAFEPYRGSAVWDNYNALPGMEVWGGMYQLAEEIAADLNSGGGKYTLEYKQKGGSSHQLFVRRVADGKDVGLWSAPNHATYIEGEIFAFNLARLLHRPTGATPGVRMTLTGPARELAIRAYRPAAVPKARQCNQAHILKYMSANRHYIVGVFKAFVPNTKPDSIPEIVDRAHKARLNAKNPIVAMINRAGPKPSGKAVYLSAKKTLSFSKPPALLATSTDLQLARELSFMALLDALNSQRDRFGPYGSNLEALINRNGSFAITAVDNGGIADAALTASLKYFVGNSGPSVSRFDRDVFERVLALDDFINGRRSSFEGFRSVGELAAALGIETSPESADTVSAPGGVCGSSNHMFLFDAPKKRWGLRWNAFVKALGLVAKHMRQFENDPSAFFD